MTRLTYRPSVRRYLANPPRAGMQQGYVGSDGCAEGPHSLHRVRLPAATFPGSWGVFPGGRPPGPPECEARGASREDGPAERRAEPHGRAALPGRRPERLTGE